MRNPILKAVLPAFLTVVALAIGMPARAGTVVVDTTSRTVETSRLFLRFDLGVPEMLIQVVFKDLSPTLNLTMNSVDGSECWGQTLRNTSSQGYGLTGPVLIRQWSITSQTAASTEVTIRSQSTGQPLVTTRYRFFPDQPYFTVNRTFGFGAVHDTAAYQAYVPRVQFVSTYRAARWRDTNGVVQQRGFCATPCLETGWNRRWVEQMAYIGHSGFAVTSYFPASMPAGTQLVDGWGPNTVAGWVAPLSAAGSHTVDVTANQLIGFSLAPDNYARLDSMWTAYTNGGFTADAADAPATYASRLAVSPNPSHGVTSIAWTSVAAGAFAIDVLDVTGRRVARIQTGWSPAGPRTAAWDGRDERGAPAAAGLYFIRLQTAAGTRIARLARAN